MQLYCNNFVCKYIATMQLYETCLMQHVYPMTNHSKIPCKLQSQILLKCRLHDPTSKHILVVVVSLVFEERQKSKHEEKSKQSCFQWKIDFKFFYHPFQNIPKCFLSFHHGHLGICIPTQNFEESTGSSTWKERYPLLDLYSSKEIASTIPSRMRQFGPLRSLCYFSLLASLLIVSPLIDTPWIPPVTFQLLEQGDQRGYPQTIHLGQLNTP